MPAFLPGARIERDEIVVRRLEVQVVVPDRRAAITDVRAALGLPVVAPELAAVVSIDRNQFIHSLHEQPPILEQRRRAAAVSLRQLQVDVAKPENMQGTRDRIGRTKRVRRIGVEVQVLPEPIHGPAQALVEKPPAAGKGLAMAWIWTY